jgi:hypothetical protein
VTANQLVSAKELKYQEYPESEAWQQKINGIATKTISSEYKIS